MRGTSNTNDRGNSTDRKRRKQFLLNTYGDGIKVVCSTCPTELSFDTITIDRFPIPGCEGGRYTRDNIRPMCGPCNYSDGGKLGNLRKNERKTMGR